MRERRRGITFARQLRLLSPLLGMWAAGAVVVAGAGLQRWVPARELFLDASYVAGAPWYTGVLSDVGILASTVAATAAAAGSWVAARTGRVGAARFLAAGAVVTVVLLANDLLQLHGAVLLGLGVPQTVGKGAVAAPALAWLLVFRTDIARSRWLFLVAAVTGLGISAAVDEIWALETNRAILVEDGAKLLGLLAWAQYFVLTALDIARSALRSWRPTADPFRPDAPEPVRAQR